MSNKSSKKQHSKGQNKNQIVNMQKLLSGLEKNKNPHFYKQFSKDHKS